MHRRLALLGLLAVNLPAQILVDTDSGFFGDDGVALTMLLRSPRAAEVQGITVVSGNVWSADGVGYMARTAKLLNRPDLPVLAGSEAPLIHSPALRRKETGIEFDGAFGLARPRPDVPGGGIPLLIRTIDANPGRITILVIGPLTNLAMVLRIRPDIAAKIGTLVIMGGNVHVPGNASKSAEFNFWFDPEAAQIVLRSAIPKKILFPLDVCNNAHLTKAIFDRVVSVKTSITDLYREDFGNRYPGFLKNPNAESSLWDELATAGLIDPKLITRTETAWLDIDTTFGPSYGAVEPLDRTLAPNATPVTVVLDMDFPKVFERYTTALTTRQ